MYLTKFLLGTILVLACSLTSQALPVYSSILTEQRSAFCKKVEATASHVAETGLTGPLIKTILSNTTSLSDNDRRTLWDALYMAHFRRSSWWSYEFCMDRVET